MKQSLNIFNILIFHFFTFSRVIVIFEVFPYYHVSCYFTFFFFLVFFFTFLHHWNHYFYFIEIITFLLSLKSVVFSSNFCRTNLFIKRCYKNVMKTLIILMYTFDVFDVCCLASFSFIIDFFDIKWNIWLLKHRIEIT